MLLNLKYKLREISYLHDLLPPLASFPCAFSHAQDLVVSLSYRDSYRLSPEVSPENFQMEQGYQLERKPKIVASRVLGTLSHLEYQSIRKYTGISAFSFSLLFRSLIPEEDRAEVTFSDTRISNAPSLIRLPI